jgi:UDP-GlcNAc3NAcA epimerase
MLVLEKNAKVILTDSGGIQKEAYWFQVLCVTLRDETEWVETVESGWNVVVGLDHEKIISTVFQASRMTPPVSRTIFGSGDVARKIVDAIPW